MLSIDRVKFVVLLCLGESLQPCCVLIQSAVSVDTDDAIVPQQGISIKLLKSRFCLRSHFSFDEKKVLATESTECLPCKHIYIGGFGSVETAESPWEDLNGCLIAASQLLVSMWFWHQGVGSQSLGQSAICISEEYWLKSVLPLSLQNNFLYNSCSTKPEVYKDLSTNLRVLKWASLEFLMRWSSGDSCRLMFQTFLYKL